MKRGLRLGAILLILAFGWLVKQREGADTTTAPVTGVERPARSERGAGEILRAFADRRSDVQVEASGVVDRTLADDNEGSRHQKFIVRLVGGHTVMISHNIDLAPRVPLAAGDQVDFAGEYEYNSRGGVVHWTHHDPRGRHKGGWIRHRGKTYE